MSYIEMPVAQYRRRLAALPASGLERPAGPAPARPVPAVTDDDVRAARIRYPQAFTALDAEASLGAAEIAEAERLIVGAIRAIHRAPE